MCFDGYRVPAKGDPSKESIWVAVLVWSGRKPSPKFCSTKDDLTFPGMPSHSLGGGSATAAGDAISNECMQIGEILEIQKYGAVASLRKDTEERAFIPGWSHQHVRSGTSFLVTSQGVELALKDLVAFYVDPKRKPRKEFKAVGCNVMVLKHGGKVCYKCETYIIFIVMRGGGFGFPVICTAVRDRLGGNRTRAKR